jgi:hypothetical protein
LAASIPNLDKKGKLKRKKMLEHQRQGMQAEAQTSRNTLLSTSSASSSAPRQAQAGATCIAFNPVPNSAFFAHTDVLPPEMQGLRQSSRKFVAFAPYL